MEQFQSLKRLLFFYILTLLIMLSLYYVAMLLELKTQSQQYSLDTFNSLQYEFTEHADPTDFEIEKILDKPFFQDISYQLVFMLPSGQTFIHRHTRPDERGFTTVTFPKIGLPFANNGSNSAYTLNNSTLTGAVKLEAGHQIYIVLRHQPPEINWISYRFWLPLMTAILLFIIALLYMLNRRANWEQLLIYTENLNRTVKYIYTPLPFLETKTTGEFLRLGHALSRISYQLHSNHRRIKTLSHRLERLVDQAPLPMLMIMRHGQISFFNRRFERIFATSLQSDTNYQLTDFVSANDKPSQDLLQKLSTLRVTRTLLVYGIANKQAYQLHITPWFGEHGQVHGFTVLLNNVNEFVKRTDDLQRQNQQLQRQLSEFSQLRSVVSHELRPPLSAIIEILERIDPETLSVQQHEVLITLTQSSHSMLAMLNDTLDMAKKEVRKTHIVSEPVDIFELGQHVSHLITDGTRRKGLELLYFFAPDCPRYIDTDSGRLRQVLVNLLDNAVKFTTSGYVALIIEPITEPMIESIATKPISQTQVTGITAEQTTINDRQTEKITNKPSIIDNQESKTAPSAHHDSSQQQHHWIRFSVKDTGIGITEAEQQLFSYLDIANPPMSQKFDGSGLGLAISNSFARLLGGFIQLESEPNRGSTFNLYLPCHKPNYQPVYHFHSSLTEIRLIAVINQTERANYLQQFCDYLSLPVSIYSHLDRSTITRLSTQLKQISKQHTAVLLLDYEYYLSETTTLAKTPVIIEGDAVSNKTSNKHAFDEIIYGKHLPKILYSKKTERNISSTLLGQFDSFLAKPLDLRLLLSELIRLTQPIMRPIAQLPSIKDDKNKPATALDKSVDAGLIPLILVVEDSRTNQKITCMLLSKLGYRSVVAEDGQQALDMLQAQRQEIALILMDCRMPVMDGLQATQAIRAQGDDIPIVALTANTTEEDRKACFAVGMDEFLSKPIDKNKLLTTLKSLIKA